ncbi:small ribosomal subunit protein uS3y-like isoform X3 [Musa acuminata AAA Group]|uniref:small ribosomal subunit protein uS3y-like isoform X3 n=1 Tax=Musa acuminata AAA Group TaxID=214697 RepID=UPI0031D63A56
MVIRSGKLRAQSAKSMKFKDGYMISSSQPIHEYRGFAVRHLLLRQEKDARDVEIPNIRWEVFELMMRFIYIGSVEITNDIA